MQAFLLKKPYEVSFSGNPMPFVFAIAPYFAAEKKTDLRLIIKILVEKNYGSSVFDEVRTQTFYPDADGMVSFDIHTIVDPFLEYYTPKPTLAKPVLAPNQRKRYKISWVLINAAEAAGAAAESPVLYAIKGGLAYEQWHPADFFKSFIQDKKQALRYHIADEKIFRDETRFLFWLYNANPDVLVDDNGNVLTDDSGNTIIMNEYTRALQVVFTVTDEAGHKYQYALPATLMSDKWSIGCAPIGFDQVGLQDLLPSGTFAVSYTVDVRNDSAYVVQPFTFILDHRNFYRSYDILYRNSLGGLESLRLRGQTDFSADYDRQQAQQIVPPAYYQNLNLQAQVLDNSNTESAKFKGDTGFVSREASDRLRDLFLSVQKFAFQDNRMMPIVINNKNTAFFTNRDSLISTLIEWQMAFVNTFYTPHLALPSVRACPPLENLQVIVLNKTTIIILYSLPIPYERVQVEVNFSVVPTGSPAMPGKLNFNYTGNTGTVVQTLALPLGAQIFPNVFFIVKAQVICDEDGEEINLGPASTIRGQLTKGSTLTALNDSYTIESGHSDYVDLEGSVLNNDSDSGGAVLEVVPVNGLTNKNGYYTIGADGMARYHPPYSTFIGADYFDYRIRISGQDETVTARVNIQVNAVQTSIFAKLVIRNEQDTNLLPNSRNTKGEIWIDFFSDPAGSVPLDVAPYGLSVNTQVDEHSFNSLSSNLPPTVSDKTTNTTYNPAGTGIKIFDGTYYNLSRYAGSISRYAEYKRTTKILAGTGYIVI